MQTLEVTMEFDRAGTGIAEQHAISSPLCLRLAAAAALRAWLTAAQRACATPPAASAGTCARRARRTPRTPRASSALRHRPLRPRAGPARGPDHFRARLPAPKRTGRSRDGCEPRRDFPAERRRADPAARPSPICLPWSSVVVEEDFHSGCRLIVFCTLVAHLGSTERDTQLAQNAA